MDKSITLGQRIKAARLQARFSQKDLAKRLNVSDKAVSTYEVERAKPTFELMQKISQITGKPISFFDNNYQPTEADLEVKLDSIEVELREIREMLQGKSRTSSRN